MPELPSKLNINEGNNVRIFCKTLFVAILFLNQISMADEGYQLETTFSHGGYKSDSGYKSNSNNFDATYYFSKVNSGNYPFEEAAFMSRSSGIGIDYTERSIESLGSKADPVSLGLNAFYASPNHPYVIGGSVSESELDSGSGFTGYESQSYSVSPGYFLQNNLLLNASFIKSETKYTGGGTFDYDSTALLAKWLNGLPSGRTYNFVAGVARSNFDSSFFGSSHSTTIFLSSDYYVTRSFSVGASVSVADSNDSDSNETTYGLSSSWFITPRLFTKLSGIKYNGESADSDNASLALGMRF